MRTPNCLCLSNECPYLYIYTWLVLGLLMSFQGDGAWFKTLNSLWYRSSALKCTDAISGKRVQVLQLALWQTPFVSAFVATCKLMLLLRPFFGLLTFGLSLLSCQVGGWEGAKEHLGEWFFSFSFLGWVFIWPQDEASAEFLAGTCSRASSCAKKVTVLLSLLIVSALYLEDLHIPPRQFCLPRQQHGCASQKSEAEGIQFGNTWLLRVNMSNKSFLARAWLLIQLATHFQICPPVAPVFHVLFAASGPWPELALCWTIFNVAGSAGQRLRSKAAKWPLHFCIPVWAPYGG